MSDFGPDPDDRAEEFWLWADEDPDEWEDEPAGTSSRGAGDPAAALMFAMLGCAGFFVVMLCAVVATGMLGLR